MTANGQQAVAQGRGVAHVRCAVVHASPGRIRLRLQRDALDGDALGRTERALAAQAGIREVRANPLARSLLVAYEDRAAPPEQMLSLIERAGLVVQGQRAQFRPCTLDATPLEEISTWAERYRPVWEARFDRIDEYLANLRPTRKTKGT